MSTSIFEKYSWVFLRVQIQAQVYYNKMYSCHELSVALNLNSNIDLSILYKPTHRNIFFFLSLDKDLWWWKNKTNPKSYKYQYIKYKSAKWINNLLYIQYIYITISFILWLWKALVTNFSFFLCFYINSKSKIAVLYWFLL